MDRFFDRLGELLRALIGEGAGDAYDPSDPDMRAAYEELDAYLRGEQPVTGGPRADAAGDHRADAAAGPADPLAEDYAALGVPFGASPADVRSAYKRLMLKYHPDRFSGDAEKQRLATDVTQRLNAAYRRIEALHRQRRSSTSAGGHSA